MPRPPVTIAVLPLRGRRGSYRWISSSAHSSAFVAREPARDQQPHGVKGVIGGRPAASGRSDHPDEMPQHARRNMREVVGDVVADVSFGRRRSRSGTSSARVSQRVELQQSEPSSMRDRHRGVGARSGRTRDRPRPHHVQERVDQVDAVLLPGQHDRPANAAATAPYVDRCSARLVQFPRVPHSRAGHQLADSRGTAGRPRSSSRSRESGLSTKTGKARLRGTGGPCSRWCLVVVTGDDDGVDLPSRSPTSVIACGIRQARHRLRVTLRHPESRRASPAGHRMPNSPDRAGARSCGCPAIPTPPAPASS